MAPETNGIREGLRQAERRLDINDREHDVLNQTIGAVNVTLSELRTEFRGTKEKLDADSAWREKWSGRLWALMVIVVVAALGAIGNLILMIGQRGSP